MLEALLLVAGLVGVIAGAEIFFKAVLDAAARIRMPAFVLTALISGFELENLAAGIAASLEGLPGAAAGTFLGGTTFLTLGVAGLAGCILPLAGNVPGPALAWAALSPLGLAGTALDGVISRPDGALLLGWFGVVMVAIARTGRHLLAPEQGPTGKRPVARVVGGLALLSIGGEALAQGLRGVVALFGVPASLLGNTVVAASVEAEELGRVAVPARRGRSDGALGNVLGTAVHFIAFNAGVIALVRPIALGSVTLRLHLPVAAASVVLLCAILGLRCKIGRREGAFLLACYGAYLIAAVILAMA